MITEIEDYFAKGCGRCPRFDTSDCSVKKWAAGLEKLRAICRASGLSEAVKWGHPCYRLDDRNIVILGAFREKFLINFMNAALMKDPHGVLEKQGDQSRHAGMISFTDAARVIDLETVIARYVDEAIGYARAGLKAPKEIAELEMPDDLIAALNQDPELATAFAGLTPGRQRSYVINLSTSQNPVTRVARIAKYRDKILAGKGATER